MISIIICVYKYSFFCTIRPAYSPQRVLKRQIHTVVMAFFHGSQFYSFNGMTKMTIPHVKAIAAAVCAACLPSLVYAADQDTVVVTATGFEQKIQNAPASISVITKQQIEDKAYRDVTDALKDVP